MEEQSVYKKLILVTSDTSGLVRMEGDINKANKVLQQMGLKSEQATKVLDKGTTITNNFGKVTTSSMSQIETASGKTFNVITKGGTQVSGAMDMIHKAMMRVILVVPLWFVMRQAFMAVVQGIQENIKFLIDLETAMTKIKIVGKGTSDEYKYMQTALVSLAHTYGTSSSEIAEASVILAQQGKSVSETIKLVGTATLAAKILGTDVKSVVEDMTAALKGFNISADDSVSVVDKWVNVSKNFAITSKDLANSIKVAGASANQLGVSISDFLGNVTAVVEVTRKSGQEAARGLSFIYARLLTTGKSTLEQVAKIPFYLDAVGKATNEVTPKMRNISDILTDLASKWGTLTTQEQLEIATSLGSKRQMQVLYGLMQNYNASLDARIIALTSAGSAEKAFQLVQDTTTYKLQQVGTAWNAFTNALLNTEGFKKTLSLFDQLIIGLTSLVNYEKAYAVLLANENNIAMLATDTRLSEIKSLNELIEVRDKLNRLTKSPENENRLNVVNEAINSIVGREENIGLKVAWDIGNIDLIKQVKEKLINDLTKEKIRLNVSLEYEPQIKALQNELDKIKNNPLWRFRYQDEVVAKESQILNLQNKQNKEIEEQYKIQLGQFTTKKLLLEGMDDENNLSGELTDKEKEKLDIQYKINDAKLSGLYNSVQLLDYEIALVTNSRYIYEEHDKNLKLYDLEKQKISEVNNLIKAQSDILQKSVSDTILAWEKGGTSLLSGFQSIGDTIRNSMMTSVAEGLSTNIMNSTGIGQIFGMMNVNLKDFTSGQGGIVGGIENGAYKGTYKGISDALGKSGINKASWTGGTGTINANGASWTLPGFGGGGWFSQPIGGVTEGGYSDLKAGQMYNAQGIPQASRGQVYGGAAMSALTGYSAYQQAGGGGMGVASGLMAGAGSLALMGSALGFGAFAGTTAGVGGATATVAAGALAAMPWLLPVLGIALLMGSQMFNSKTQTSTTTSTQENAISSKISVSNKQLELVNRNLIALRTTITTYLLPSSAYFSMKSGNIENEYSIMSRAGYSG